MKRILTMILVFAMCISAVGITAFAGGYGPGYGSSGGPYYYIIAGDGVKRSLDVQSSGAGWSYNGNHVLTLNGFDAGDIVYYCDYNEGRNLEIVLVGTNKVNGKVLSNDSGISNGKPYGHITFTGSGSVEMKKITGCEFTFSQCTATVDMIDSEEHMTLNMNRRTCVKDGATLNVFEDNSGGSLGKEKIDVAGAVVNISNLQQSYYDGKANLTITAGGVVNATSTYHNGGFLCRYDSSALSDYLVTDKNGTRVQLEENKWGNISGCLVSPSAPTVRLSYICISEYTALSQGGHRVADWAKNDIETAISADLIPDCLDGADLRNNISRLNFAAVAVNLYEKMSGETIAAAQVPFEDLGGVSSELRDVVGKVYAAGLMNGMGNNTFSPDTPLTREQASTVLFRIYTKLGGEVPATTSTFADGDKISSWAKEAVLFMADKGILKGVGNNTFAPQNNTQGQQAVIIALRMFNNLK